MMPSFRVIKQRLWLFLGLLLVIAGGTAATMGYLAARESAKLATLVTSTPSAVKPGATTKQAAPGATTRLSIRSSRGGNRRAATTRKTSSIATAKPATTRSSTAVTANANDSAGSLSRFRGMMWWGAAVLVVGVVSVAYSIHSMREKPPPTGADELLNDAPPF